MRTQEQSRTPSSRWENAIPKLMGMKLPLPKERTSFPDDKLPVVDLAHFAAIGGLTRKEYLVRMMEALRDGKPEDVHDIINKRISPKSHTKVLFYIFILLVYFIHILYN